MAFSKKEVILSPQAVEDLDNLYSFISENWGIGVLKKFVQELEEFLLIVAIHPKLFSFLNKSLNIRKHTLYKHNLIVYRNTRKRVEVIAIFNAHQNPKKIKKHLKQRL